MGKFDDLKVKKKSVDSFIDGVEDYQNQVKAIKVKEVLERLNVEIPKPLHKSIKMRAVEEDKKIKEIVIKALNEYLKK